MAANTRSQLLENILEWHNLGVVLIHITLSKGDPLAADLLTNQSRAMTNLFKFCVFRQILIRFGLGANIGLKTKLNEFEMNTAIF